MNSTPDYYPALDGLRGVSIILVLCVHLHLISPATSYVFAGGSLGVDVFFVISGFLIISILLNENANNGRIGLGNFYARRILRLFPALVSVVLFTCLVAKSRYIAHRVAELPAGATRRPEHVTVY